MLETTLATTFVPGTNLKGKVAGANWSFILPRLELTNVICIGAPPFTTLTTLASVSQTVHIILADDQAIQATPTAALENLCWHNTLKTPTLPLADHSVDLLFIADRRACDWIMRDQLLTNELSRLLTPEGLIYYEYSGLTDPLRGGQNLHNLIQPQGTTQRFWLTPLSGEMHTAVPSEDRHTVHYFMAHKFYSANNVLRTWLKQIGRAVGAKDKAQKTVLSTPKKTKGGRKTKSWKSSLRTVVRRLGGPVLSIANGIEEFFDRQALRNPFFQRQGVLLDRTGQSAEQQLPMYLQTLAQTADVDLRHYRWGLMARGDYSSRKLIFFLFNQASTGAAAAPQYVVKMVRDAAYNARLENESRALLWLQEHGIGDVEILPQVVFSGRHADLAIVGETVINGMPFRQKTASTAECPYVQRAIELLTEIGAATADPTVATPTQVMHSVNTLFEQFVAIYRPTPDEFNFLTEQIARFGYSPKPIPLVFQHGDPGTWNAMVTPNGRIALLDWEAAEVHGMPLWDLFYFLRSYCVGAARALGAQDPLAGFAQYVLEDTPLGQLFIKATLQYCERTGVPQALIGPLFYTCWMHRSLKEATRLTQTQLDSGHYVNLLRLSIQKRNSPTSSRLFGGSTSGCH